MVLIIIAEDTAFANLKLNEIGSWLSRRSYAPSSVAGAVSRAWWRWQMKYVQPKRTGMAPFFHLAFFGMGLFYVLNYKRIRNHKNYKYH
jgi:F-type H+-transporting ATPase subunit f